MDSQHSNRTCHGEKKKKGGGGRERERERKEERKVGGRGGVGWVWEWENRREERKGGMLSVVRVGAGLFVFGVGGFFLFVFFVFCVDA